MYPIKCPSRQFSWCFFLLVAKWNEIFNTFSYSLFIRLFSFKGKSVWIWQYEIFFALDSLRLSYIKIMKFILIRYKFCVPVLDIPFICTINYFLNAPNMTKNVYFLNSKYQKEIEKIRRVLEWRGDRARIQSIQLKLNYLLRCFICNRFNVIFSLLSEWNSYRSWFVIAHLYIYVLQRVCVFDYSFSVIFLFHTTIIPTSNRHLCVQCTHSNDGVRER